MVQNQCDCKRKYTKPSRFVYFLFLLFQFPTSGFAQTECDSAKITLYSKQEIFQILTKNPAQTDCFFEQIIAKNAPTTNVDSILNLFSIWKTVSPNPCKADFNNELFLIQNASIKTSIPRCETLYTFYKQCGKSYFNHPLRNAAFDCENFNCESLDSLFFQNGKIELEDAKKLSSLFAQKNCTNSSTYLKAQATIIEQEPNFNALYHQAELYRNANKMPEAYAYYAKAEKYASFQEQKSVCYLGIARLLEKQKEYSKAKDFGILATEADTKNQESFVFLATLYQKAESVCAFKAEVERCALSLLIAKMYAQAGKNTEKEQFIIKSKYDILVKAGTIIPKTTQYLACFIDTEIELNK